MSKYYFAVDVETTGLNHTEYGMERKNVMLQMAFKILNENFEVLCEDNGYFRDVEVTTLWNMNPYVFDMHCKTGLLQRLHSKDNLVSYKDFQDHILGLLNDTIGDSDYKLIPLGNNVQFDVEVIRRHMPMLFSRFHYSFFDVSVIRNFLDSVSPVIASTIYECKESNHDASTDITACLKELYVYTNLVGDVATTKEELVCDYIKELYEQSSEMYDKKSV